MKALERLLLKELGQVREAESKLQRAFRTLGAGSVEQIAAFVDELTDLDYRACRVEKLLDAIAQPKTTTA